MRRIDGYGLRIFQILKALLDSSLSDEDLREVLVQLTCSDDRLIAETARSVYDMIVNSFWPEDLKRGREIAVHQFNEWEKRLQAKTAEVDSRVCDAMCYIAERTLVSP